MSHLTLSEIWIYPIKSLGGIKLNRARVLQKGLQYDRRWMLIDENAVFMTQRTTPEMALFKLSINGDQLTVTFKKNPHAPIHSSIIINANAPALGPVTQAIVWNDEVQVIEVDQQLSDWFSDCLELRCRLVSFPEESPRPVDPDYKVNDEHVSLADAFPFLIIGQSSLDDLNERMTHHIGMDRFRPNFVFTGGNPYEEDSWRNFSIGASKFVGVKPCARCAVPTIDQETAEKGIEPSLTLSTYRRRENKVYFGQNVVAVEHDWVNVGDRIILN